MKAELRTETANSTAEIAHSTHPLSKTERPNILQQYIFAPLSTWLACIRLHECKSIHSGTYNVALSCFYTEKTPRQEANIAHYKMTRKAISQRIIGRKSTNKAPLMQPVTLSYLLTSTAFEKVRLNRKRWNLANPPSRTLDAHLKRSVTLLHLNYALTSA